MLVFVFSEICAGNTSDKQRQYKNVLLPFLKYIKLINSLKRFNNINRYIIF